MSDKTTQINFCKQKIQEVLNYLRPGNRWNLVYTKPEDVALSTWNRKYLQLLDSEDYFIIYVNDEPLYAINVTGDSVLTAIRELVDKLADKF